MIAPAKRQHGFGAIAAIVVLVILALFAAAMVSIGSAQQMTITQDVLAARAWQAARAGNEWGLFKARNQEAWPAPAGAVCNAGAPQQSTTLDLRNQSGFNVTISCTAWRYNEGETAPDTPRVVRIYRIVAVACPAAACPDMTAAAAAPGYVERTRTVLISD